MRSSWSVTMALDGLPDRLQVLEQLLERGHLRGLRVLVGDLDARDRGHARLHVLERLLAPLGHRDVVGVEALQRDVRRGRILAGRPAPPVGVWVLAPELPSVAMDPPLHSRRLGAPGLRGFQRPVTPPSPRRHRPLGSIQRRVDVATPGTRTDHVPQWTRRFACEMRGIGLARALAVSSPSSARPRHQVRVVTMAE